MEFPFVGVKSNDITLTLKFYKIARKSKGGGESHQSFRVECAKVTISGMCKIMIWFNLL